MTHIEEQAAAMQECVDAYRDQQSAALYVECDWTQQRIGEATGKSQPYVCQLLCFGRFLQFIASGNNPQKPPKNFTERKFRSLWEQTEAGATPA